MTILFDQHGAPIGQEKKISTEDQQAVDLRAITEASHRSIYDNHSPLRMQAIVDAVASIDGLTHADILMATAVLMANIGALHDGKWLFAAQCGVFSHVKTMLADLQAPVPADALPA